MSSIALYVFLAMIIGVVFYHFEDKILSFIEKTLNVKVKKRNCKSLDCYTYFGLNILLSLILIIFLFCLYFPVVIDTNNFPVFVGFIFMFLYPLIFMMIRKNTFNENTISYAGLGHSPRNMLEKCTGYCPIWYWLLSLIIGGSSTVWGFSMLNFPEIPLYAGLIILFSGLISQTFILFPDIIDKFISIDMKTIKGLKLMLIITVILSIILIALRVIIITFLI